MLDPTLNTYALAVAGASGVVAAGMHGTSVLSSAHAPPSRRELIGQFIRTFVVGVATSLVVRWLPWKFDLVAALVVAAIVGGVLGPRGLSWFLDSGLSVLKRLVPVLSSIPDPPAPEPDAPPESPKPLDPSAPAQEVLTDGPAQ